MQHLFEAESREAFVGFEGPTAVGGTRPNPCPWGGDASEWSSLGVSSCGWDVSGLGIVSSIVDVLVKDVHPWGGALPRERAGALPRERGALPREQEALP